MREKNQERDELRASFTVWMKTIAWRTRKKYLAARSNEANRVPLENVPEENFTSTDTPETALFEAEFDFEEETLAKAFYQLPYRKQEVLIKIFVLDLTPDEIAREWDCQIHNVYKQQSLALKSLREFLKEGETHEP